jgi:hypothetical protein
MGNSENPPEWWERMKQCWRSRRAGDHTPQSFADGARSGSGSWTAGSETERCENAGDNACAEALFQAADQVRERGAVVHRADPLNFGGSLFGFSAGDANTHDPQAFADPGPFVDLSMITRAAQPLDNG